MNAPVYVDIDQGIHKVKLKVARNEKQKKTSLVFFFYKHSKFWSVSPDKKSWSQTSFFWRVTYFHKRSWKNTSKIEMSLLKKNDDGDENEIRSVHVVYYINICR